MRTRVVHFKKEPYDVYIGRPSKWGNPFVVGEDGTRDEVIAKYRAHLFEHPELLHAIGPELQGRVLGCWCKPDHCHGDVLAEIADGVRASEGEVEEQPPKPKFAPAEQSILPGYKKHVPSPPIDYRAWNDGRGNKLDSPAYRGRTSGAGKLIPPLVGSDGQPIRLGTLQLVRDARGAYVVVDWSKPFYAGDEKKMQATDGNEDDGPRETPLMGKQVWRTNDLADAKRAMAALHQFAEDLRKSLPADPAPCFDLAGKRVQIGDLSLRRFSRGKMQGRYAVVNERLSIASKKRVTLLKAATFKEAVFGFERERKRREASPKPQRFVGAPISFSAPSGGTGSSFIPFDQREYPEPDSLSWKTAVDLYAQTGRWPKSAEYPTGRPAALEAEAEEAREAYLIHEASRVPELEPVDDPEALAAMARLPEADQAILNQMLEQFDGALVSIELHEKEKAR